MRAIGAVAVLAVVILAVGPAVAQDCSDLFDEHQVLSFYVTMSSSDWGALRNSCLSALKIRTPKSLTLSTA